MSALDEDMEAAASSTDGVIVRQLAMVPDELQSRDRELAEIARSIASLAELFKDLQALVIDQGTLLDSVEYNIEQTATHMEDAVRELDTATKYVDSVLFPSARSRVSRVVLGLHVRVRGFSFSRSFTLAFCTSVSFLSSVHLLHSYVHSLSPLLGHPPHWC
ncbi:hypothetical protein NUW54_g13040 [Trametes sanguinea]|uniref:Uncharacterized protein n=1 Tax=Trametes sanguinea TaxID=158606 RepID=A0ACC1MQ70_9APHY|nr:hypothetical protein NUW54_g13040 [Trametes sanguinea]